MTARIRPEHLHPVLLGGLALVIGSWAAASLAWPIGWDHGVFAWVGGVIADGGMPYRDAWDVKGPVPYALFAIMEVLLGRTPLALRLFDLVILGVGAYAVYRLVHSVAGRTPAGYGAGLFILWYASVGYYDTAQPDGWVAMATAGLAVPLFGRRTVPSRRAALGIGALIGWIALVKPLYLAFGALPLWWLISHPELPSRERWRFVRYATLGGLGAVGAVLLWLLAGGALRDFWETYLVFNIRHNQMQEHASLRTMVMRLYRHFVTDPAMLLALPIAASGLAFLRRTSPRDAVLLLVWFLVIGACLAAQAGDWPYRWHILLPPLATAAAAGLIPAVLDRSQAQVFASLYLLLLVAVSAVTPARDAFRWMRWTVGVLSEETYRRSFEHHRYSVVDDLRLAAYLRRNTEADTPVLVYADPGVNWLAGRPSIGRFAFHVPLRAKGVVEDPDREERIREFLASLERTRPRIIALKERTITDSLDWAGRPNRSRIPAFGALLQRAYALDTTIGAFEVYRLLP